MQTKKLLRVLKEAKNIKPDILPKSGAGQDGTKELVRTYQRDTPGQLVNFKEWKKHK